MAKFTRIPVSNIYVGERQRPVDVDHAMAIAASMEERGLINPVTVRSTPNQNGGKTPFTLVAGGHRLFAAQSLEWEEIDAILVAADANEAILIEIAENLFRNDLTALNRALFVAKYRETWEETQGVIQRGGNRFISEPKGSKGHEGPLVKGPNRHDGGNIFYPGKELSKRVQERLGISGRTYERITQIAVHLHPDLRQVLRGTDAEDDQTRLLKLSKLPRDDQAKIAAGLKELPDLKKVLEMALPKAEVTSETDLQAEVLSKLLTAWKTASDETRAAFLDKIGVSE